MDPIFESETLKNRLLKNLERLPESSIQEVLDFAEFIRVQRNKEGTPKKQSKLVPKRDPILKLIGIADVEPFAHRVDQELYGR